MIRWNRCNSGVLSRLWRWHWCSLGLTGKGTEEVLKRLRRRSLSCRTRWLWVCSWLGSGNLGLLNRSLTEELLKRLHQRSLSRIRWTWFCSCSFRLRLPLSRSEELEEIPDSAVDWLQWFTTQHFRGRTLMACSLALLRGRSRFWCLWSWID